MRIPSALRCLFTLSLLAPLPLVSADRFPDDVEAVRFAGPERTPSPACVCVGADGTVFVGVDLNGSLGKGPGKGRILRLIDEDQDGVADSHSVFAEIDNARGLVSVGDQLFVLHTHFADDGMATGMNLIVLQDTDQDGVADDEGTVLVEGICAAESLNSRGTDHSTNGIQLGIDGWIYIAVGDFGFHDATGTDGRKLTLLGGGIVRVRPDGTEMELYTTGMRNIYDVAIDPAMNLYTRGNTNDGGGWNVRFTHHLQSARYGYPRLFKNFADEILPALEDLGGGSGCGAFFLSEPTWPAAYRDQPLMADWGRKAIYLHRLSEDGATFQQTPEEFAVVSQVTDLDVDPTGQMFVTAWDGAGFKGDDSKGYTLRLTPKDWQPASFPVLTELSVDELVALLASESATTRLHVQQELLRRDDLSASRAGLDALIRNADLSVPARMAGLWTLAQLDPQPGAALVYADDAALRETALRATADRLPRLEGAELPLEPFVAALREGSPRQQAAAAVALGRIGNPEATAALLAVPYTKPEPEGEPKFSQLDTIKTTRRSQVDLRVRPGQTLYLSLSETNPVEEASELTFAEPHFVLSGGDALSLTELAPQEGEVFMNQQPDGTPLVLQSKKSSREITGFVAKAGALIAFTVPDQAVRFRTTVALSATSPKSSSVDFFASIEKPDTQSEGGGAATPRHSTPNAALVVPHLSAQALMRLESIPTLLSAVGSSQEDLALWALSWTHDEAVVDGLLDQLPEAGDTPLRRKLLTTLARLVHQEAPYDGSWWWTTRPDTRGPYYKPVTWEASDRIVAALKAATEEADADAKSFLADLNDRHRLEIEELGSNLVEDLVEEQPSVDLAEIASKAGAIATTPIEDIILALDQVKPDLEKGEELFTQQGCIACHALDPQGRSLGPFMGQIGSIMNAEQIATAILRPNDTISQGFQSIQITTKDGAIHMGFVTESDADKMVMRDMAGQEKTVKTSDIESELHLPTSMMPPGLANALSIEDFVSMVQYLAEKK